MMRTDAEPLLIAVNMNAPTLKIIVKNLYGTPRYFPDCALSRAICAVRGRNNKTLLLEHINALNSAGFKFRITDWRGKTTEI